MVRRQVVRSTCAELCSDPASVLARLVPGADVVLELTVLGRDGLRLLGVLARLRLAASRSGATLTVHPGTPGGLAELAELAGLAGLRDVLGLEPGGEAEAQEQVGPEEVVDVGDPAV